MKRKTLLIIAALGTLLSGCATDQKRIEKAAYGYLDAMGNYRFDDAYDYATQETQTNTLDVIQQRIMPTTDMDYIHRNTPAEITITGVTIIDDTTALVSFHKSTPIQEQDGTLDMHKRGNRWLAHVLISLPPLINDSKNDTLQLPTRDTLHLQVLDRR